MRLLSITALFALGLAAPVQADPAVGLGLSFTFGTGGVNTGLGIRVFSDDREDRVVGAIGLDYQFATGTFRGTVGPAYLGRNSYIGLDLGFGLNGGGVDFGIGLGGAGTKKPAAPAAAPDPVTGPGPVPGPGPGREPVLRG
jgi:hypothetical protein